MSQRLTGRYMQLPSSGGKREQFNRKICPPEGWPRLNAGALPLGVMVFALLDDFVNLKDLHIQYDSKNSCHRDAAATAHTAER